MGTRRLRFFNYPAAEAESARLNLLGVLAAGERLVTVVGSNVIELIPSCS
jgi:hypothetical protein